ncbi:hypothetical protein F2Q68_00020545 [Brassica cretica]|uniref:Uncharacterized protein n=1 Tax=Brassica cretica TaxID=69181 RepID=A0A8S9G501_BRACR|nr:hypothetical protein F2Q68_00020545 [Brassica cretica]
MFSSRFAKKEKKAFDYESLQQHGYKAVGLPDLPPPVEKADWSWATGKDKQRPEEVKESFREREATRAAVAGGETIANAQLRSDRKSLSFSQKEKKKRDLGQASRGKNYVEEEKRQLRESARFAKKEKKAFDYESLQQHGYKAVGLPDLPPPVEKANWSWATGKDKQRPEEVKESFREREATRAAVAGGETIANAQLRSDRKSLSFSQKEKKKRDLGQASRGKNYVEEEKRQLKESGVYSGFDS